jgi:hypothetical protein
MDAETAERVWGGAIGIDVYGMPRQRHSSITNVKLKPVDRRTGMVRRRKIRNPGVFPIVTPTGVFFSDHRLIPDRRQLPLKR